MKQDKFYGYAASNWAEDRKEKRQIAAENKLV